MDSHGQAWQELHSFLSLKLEKRRPALQFIMLLSESTHLPTGMQYDRVEASSTRWLEEEYSLVEAEARTN